MVFSTWPDGAVVECGGREGRPERPKGIDELTMRRWRAPGVSLADAAARSDAALTSLIAMWRRWEMAFTWSRRNTNRRCSQQLHPPPHPPGGASSAAMWARPAASSRSRLRDAQARLRRTSWAALYNLAGVRVAQSRNDDALALLDEARLRPDLSRPRLPIPTSRGRRAFRALSNPRAPA